MDVVLIWGAFHIIFKYYIHIDNDQIEMIGRFSVISEKHMVFTTSQHLLEIEFSDL